MAAKKAGTKATEKAEAACHNECKCQQAEGNFAIAAAFLVIFTAMIQPEYSVGLSVGFLVAFAVYKYLMGKGKWPCKACK